jgi:hypothetical protein
MKDCTSAINTLARKWYRELRKAIDEVLHVEIFDKDFDWLDTDENRINPKSLSAAMPHVWDVMGDEFKKELLKHAFEEWGVHTTYMVRRRMHEASSTCEWIFRCLLAGFLDSNPQGLAVGGADTKALYALGARVKRDLKRMYGQFIIPETDEPEFNEPDNNEPENESLSRESAKNIIDALVYPPL